MRSGSLLMIALMVCLLALAVGCAKKECEFNSDCVDKVASKGECFKISCDDGQCKSSPKPDCCGNGICDDSENSCSCAADCTEDVCEEKSVVIGKTSRGKDIDAQYLGYFCDANENCKLGIDPAIVQTNTILDTLTMGLCKMQIKASNPKPFDINSDEIYLELTIKDDTESLIYPVKITELRIMEGDSLLGQKNVQISFDSIGQMRQTRIGLDTSLEMAEQEAKLKLEADYEYERDRGSGNSETVRSTLSFGLGTYSLADSEAKI